MKPKDLNEAFIEALYSKEKKRANLVNRISEILKIEKEAAYRRLSSKVNFSIREMGIIAEAYSISLDNLLYNSPDYLWMPLLMESPVKIESIDLFCNLIATTINSIQAVCRQPTEAGHIIHYIPLAFCVDYPELFRFMIFKWGYYFVNSDQYLKFADWEMPAYFGTVKEKVYQLTNFSKTFYIWDSGVIAELVAEIANLQRMNILIPANVEQLKNELKELMLFLEKWLSDTQTANPPYSNQTDFYVSTVNIGFGGSYYLSTASNLITLSTKFSYSLLQDRVNSCIKMKEWMLAMRNVSVMISDSGSIQRRLFFQKQHELLEQLT